MNKDKMSQGQIDNLIEKVNSGQISDNKNSNRYICLYCKEVIRFKYSENKEVINIFLDGCKRNKTGHQYYKEDLMETSEGGNIIK